jgi:hypothetical protein
MTSTEHGPSLVGAWTHSFEEDEGEVQVFRPTHGFAFPLSRRGRESLEFRASGEVMTSAPGPDDRHRASTRSVTPLGMNRYRFGAAAGKSDQLVEVVEQASDLLKLRFL